MIRQYFGTSRQTGVIDMYACLKVNGILQKFTDVQLVRLDLSPGMKLDVVPLCCYFHYEKCSFEYHKERSKNWFIFSSSKFVSRQIFLYY